jgi:hypothetical protein
MKKLNLITLVAVVCCGLIASTSAVTADQGDIQGNGDASVTGTFDSTNSKLQLTGSVAVNGTSVQVTGIANIESEDANGTVTDEVEIQTKGLPADTYTVAITKVSDGTTLTLGTFTVTAPPTGKHHGDRRQGVTFGTTVGQPLPAGFDPTDIATVTVTGSLANLVLSGDFSTATTSTRSVTIVDITAGSVAPNAAGTVTIETDTPPSGVPQSRFLLEAENLPASSSYTLAINGTDVEAVTTNSHGRLFVRTLPSTVDISTITSVTVHDASSNVVLSATP